MANKKIVDLTQDSAPDPTDETITVDAPAGSAINKKVTWKDAVEAGMSTAVVTMTGAVQADDFRINEAVAITSTSTEINKLDGFTGAAADLNYAADLNATGVTDTEFDTLDGITATTAELNKLSGASANVTAANLNTLTAGVSSDADALHTHDSLVSQDNNFLGVGDYSTTRNSNFVIPFDSGCYTATNMDQASLSDEWRGAWFQGDTGSATASVITKYAIYGVASGSALDFSSTYTKIIVEFDIAINSVAVANGNFCWGLVSNVAALVDYDDATYYDCCFSVDTSGDLYGHTANAGGGAAHTETAITGITLTNVNKYRIEFTKGVDAKFYVNGVLKATNTTNLPATGGSVLFGAGLREDAATVSYIGLGQPQFSIEF